MTETQVKILEQLSILETDNPNIVVVRLVIRGGEAADYAVNRSMLPQLADHLAKQASADNEPLN